MEEQKRVYIYCRVSHPLEIELLHYQADLLSNYANDHNYLIIGLLKEIDDGLSLHSNKLFKLLDSIINGFIDAILIYSTDRLLCDAAAYTEFELLCLMHNVSIIIYKDVAQ